MVAALEIALTPLGSSVAEDQPSSGKPLKGEQGTHEHTDRTKPFADVSLTVVAIKKVLIPSVAYFCSFYLRR